MFHKEQRKFINRRISVYGATSSNEKFLLVFFTDNMDSKKIKSVSEFMPNIREFFKDKFILYMDNDAKHASVETLKWYNNCETETEVGSLHYPDINTIENV